MNPTTNEVSVQFPVHNEDLANYLAEYEDSEQADVMERAFRAGVITLQLSETTKDIGQESESLQTSFKEEIEQC